MASSNISVFTTLYNHERYIEHALHSALRQTLLPAEVIVIDDASTDDSVRVARSVNNSLVRVYEENINLGGANTVKGLKYCTGEFVAILNSDDAWVKYKLERQLQVLLDHPNVGAVFTHVKLIDQNGMEWGAEAHGLQRAFNKKNRTRHEWLRHFFLNGNPFCASSALMRRRCFNELGYFNGAFIQLQDMDMWTRLAIAGHDLYVIEEPLTYYRIMRDGTNLGASNSNARAVNHFEYAKMLQHFWRLPSLNDLKCIFPEIETHDRADDSLILFYLARYASRLPALHHQLFALETMSRWGGDQAAMKLAQECHGFDFRKYRAFLSAGPIRSFLNFDIHYQLNRLAMKVFPYSAYQFVKTQTGKFIKNI